MKQVNFEIPDEINFLELGLHQNDAGHFVYNMTIFKSFLAHNGLSIDDITQDDAENILVAWYFAHKNKGGEPDWCMEQVINEVSDQPKYPPIVWYDAIIEPPTPEQIADLRKHTQLTQSQTANLLGLSSQNLVSKYESGDKTPNKQTYTLWLLLTGQHPTLEVLPRIGLSGEDMHATKKL